MKKQTILLLILCVLYGLSIGSVTGAETVKQVTVPERKIPKPEEAGKKYPVPPTNWKKDPVLWGWTCELANGSGLAFGGVDQLSGTGRPHTRMLAGGKWVKIVDKLRKSNPLQKYHKRVIDLRDTCKDTLAAARHIYFEGRPAGEEAGLISKKVNPGIAKLLKDLKSLGSELKRMRRSGKYEAGQVKFALSHLAAAVGHIKPFGARTTPEQMAEMRKGQIELEIAAEAFDAEPPPRALSLIAYEPKTRLFVIFGGDHMDYTTNDLWVFDPAKLRWFQRHTDGAPAPRGDHHFKPLGDGRIAMYGGYSFKHGKGYGHMGPAKWIYDVKNNTWTPDGHKEKTFPSDTRSGRYGVPAGPEHFMKGSRPNAAANEAVLKALPVNTWVRMKTPVALGGRDWGTWIYDSDRDMFYVYAGGHCSYAGNDVARYHLATDRWEISDPVEIPLGCCGTNEQYPSGFNFNRRPWVKKHVWNGQAYDPIQKKMVLGSVNDGKLDRYFYIYDPDRAEWSSRHPVPGTMGNDAYGIQLRSTKYGMLAWYGGQVWLLDARTLQWKSAGVKGKMPGTSVDNCGLVYDSKRDRMLFVSIPYGKPFDGQLYALNMKTRQVKPLNPEGFKAFNNWFMFLRETAYHPESDMFLWPQRFKLGKTEMQDRYVAYDAAKNRWVTLKLAKDPKSPPFNMGVCSGINWDAKRKLFWVGNSSWNGGVWVLRFDPSKTEIKPVKESASPAPAAKK